ncbi:MAG: gephyrin-like molybdotransferase Glp [Anaerolineales bacterium]|jgi:molybdopterin molybdotransferase
MTEFLNLLSVEEVRSRLLDGVRPLRAAERLATPMALGRVTSAEVLALEAMPSFARSEVDGYAVRARDTHGASAALPAYLRLIGEVPMGRPASIAVAPGQAAGIHTGGQIPEGSDAVIMLEDTQISREGEIEILKPVSFGENVLRVGEDVQPGQVLLPSGQQLRPQDVGGLMGAGVLTVEVVRRPRVAIVATGDEIISPERKPTVGQVRDINSYILEAIVKEAGAESVGYGIVPDDYQELKSVCQRALLECDGLVISAGSSVSARDMTAGVVAEISRPGIIAHGVALKPGKPTLVALHEGKPILGLPGNPVSATVVARLLLIPAVMRQLGRRGLPRRPGLRLRVTHNLDSQTGREDFIPCRLVQREGEEWADPVFGKSNLIFTLVRADGLLVVPGDANGVAQGEWVEFLPFDV